MHRTLLAFVAVFLLALPAAASDMADVKAAVNRFVAAFNKGDVKTVAQVCADEASIIDEFPPHEWHGPSACTTWMADYDADAKKKDITDGVVTLNEPRYVEITGDRAYVVTPANYIYKRKGTPVKEIGSTFTLALRKEATGWRITGWAWAKR